MEPDIRKRDLVLIQRVGIDDRQINSAQIEEELRFSVGPRVTIGKT